MRVKKACLIINPHGGQNFDKLSHVLAIFAAAGWKTDIRLKEFGGQAIKLARRAAKKGYDLVIAFGGDGTLSQVVNGVMSVDGKQSIVGVLPGGTANQWASELGIPTDPVKAALTLVSSRERAIDIGHVEIKQLARMQASGDGQEAAQSQEAEPVKGNISSCTKQHFLLTVGLGIDARVIGHVSKPLKYRMGRLAFGVAALKELPGDSTFPIKVQVHTRSGKGEAAVWEGRALQVIVGNTRRYADVVELTPNAYIDDGTLDMCVITSGTPLSTVQQLLSLLVLRKPDNMSTEYFHGAHLTVTIPASVAIQVDGSAVKTRDYLDKAHRKAIQEEDNPEEVMVSYRFDALPHSLRVAVPTDYHGPLFEQTEGHGKSHAALDSPSDITNQENQNGEEQEESEQQDEDERRQLEELASRLLRDGRIITVTGMAQLPEKEHTYIVAGTTTKASTGEQRPVAVVIDEHTPILQRDGAPAPIDILGHQGTQFVVEGKMSRRGVLKARRIVI